MAPLNFESLPVSLLDTDLYKVSLHAGCPFAIVLISTSTVHNAASSSESISSRTMHSPIQESVAEHAI